MSKSPPEREEIRGSLARIAVYFRKPGKQEVQVRERLMLIVSILGKIEARPNEVAREG